MLSEEKIFRSRSTKTTYMSFFATLTGSAGFLALRSHASNVISDNLKHWWIWGYAHEACHSSGFSGEVMLDGVCVKSNVSYLQRIGQHIEVTRDAATPRAKTDFEQFYSDYSISMTFTFSPPPLQPVSSYALDICPSSYEKASNLPVRLLL